MSELTLQQRDAITGRGNLLVVAGAGTGKTHTLVARCLRFVIDERASLENILMVTFTEVAAAEMRARIREELRRRQAAHLDDEKLALHLARQLALLDTARICTLHSFCLQLAREHFYELALDPQFRVLDEQQTRPLVRDTLDVLLEEHYAGEADSDQAVQALIRSIGRGSDKRIRELVLKLHRHLQTLPNAGRWLDEQQSRLERVEPDEWRRWFLEALVAWREESLELVAALAGEAPAVKLCHEALKSLPVNPDSADAARTLRAIHGADDEANWPFGTKGTVRKSLKDFFGGGEFFRSLLPDEQGNDPIAQDWEWVRPHMTALVSLTREFTARFTVAKRELAGVDFADLEQCALRLLRDPAIADEWRGRLAQVFVDEYQDINDAQDAILTALSRSDEEANRFLVGDVKQSIYRFRLANPRIFGRYEERWSRSGADGRRIPLTENFRSRAALLNFVNPVFAALMRPEVGGVSYEALEFGAPDERAALTRKAGDRPCVEFHLIARADEQGTQEDSDTETDAAQAIPDLLAIEREARLVARQLRELKENGQEVWDKERKCLRPAKWSDMAVLLRSPSGRTDAFAMEFSKAGVPLIAARDGFFASLEVSDLLNLLRLLDNPLQDVPLAAVLRSPLVGLSLDELAQLRVQNPAKPFWTALARFREVESLESKVQSPESKVRSPESAVLSAEHAPETLREGIGRFFDQFHRWRKLARQSSLSQCLETALAETHYEAMLQAGARGVERTANVRRLLDLAQQFDPYQRQGLHRFLRFVEAQEEEELGLQPELAPAEDAVRLISVHKSKGLEFPVVALACLGTRFNERDLNESVLLSERHGLCPKITPPHTEQNYPSLPYWVARRGERLELRGEELRLLYVAMTRARDRLILTGTTNRKAGDVSWHADPQHPISTPEVVGARSQLDWLLTWLPRATVDADWQDDRKGQNTILSWRIYEGNDKAFADKVAAPLGEATCFEVCSASDTALVEELKVRLSQQYRFESATLVTAKTSVSAMRRRAVEEMEAESKRMFDARVRRTAARRIPAVGDTRLSAAERGNAHHRFLQLVDLNRAGSEAELIAEARELLQSGRMSKGEIAALDFAGIAAFWQSDLGRHIRGDANCVRRELAFTARFKPAELAAITGESSSALNEDFIVVQGVADLVVLRPNDIWLVDFKTDEVASDEITAKARLYEPQLKLYSLALARIYGWPVTASWLHFLSVPQTVQITPLTRRYEQSELF